MFLIKNMLNIHVVTNKIIKKDSYIHLIELNHFKKIKRNQMNVLRKSKKSFFLKDVIYLHKKVKKYSNKTLILIQNYIENLSEEYPYKNSDNN